MRARYLLPAAVLALIVSFSAFSETVWDQTYGFYVNPPDGFTIVDGKDPAALAFTDPSRHAAFQVVRYPASRFSSALEMAKDIKSKLSATGDTAAFTYNGREAVLGDFSFSTKVADVRGYDVFIHGENDNYALLSYAPVGEYDQFHDLLLSALDSFSSGDEGLLYPGPISQFYRPLPQAGDTVSSAQQDQQKGSPVPFSGGVSIDVPFGPKDADASQVVIEREARILAAYQLNGKPVSGWEKAWERYYQMIFRDNYHRLDAVADGIARSFDGHDYSDYEKAQKVLSWLQHFHYVRTDTISDLESPVSCVLGQSGDCDSLGITDAIVLYHLGINSILMVSVKYSHSMVGVDVPGPGARFAFGKKQYLVSELTAPVRIGQIARDVADPAYWIGINLIQTP